MVKSSTKKKYKFEKFSCDSTPTIPVAGTQQRITCIVKPIGGRVAVDLSFLQGDNELDCQAASETNPNEEQFGKTRSVGEEPVSIDIVGQPLELAYMEYLESVSNIPDIDTNAKRKRKPGVSSIYSKSNSV